MDRGSVVALKEMQHVFGSLFEVIVARKLRERDFFGEKIYFEDIAFVKRVLEVTLPTSIMFEVRANVPANLAMFTKGRTGIGGRMSNNLGAHGGQWCPIEIELTEE